MCINARRFENRVALVTGCGSRHGIGFATAALLMKSGAGVAVTSTTDRIFKRQATLEASGGRAVARTADLTRMDQTRSLVDDVISRFGRIVNISSVTGPLVSNPGEAAYSAAKTAMVGMGRSLDMEVARDGITVNSVAPGWIETASSTEEEITAGAHTPMGRCGTPQEVADLIAFLASDEVTYPATPLLPSVAEVTVEQGVATSTIHSSSRVCLTYGNKWPQSYPQYRYTFSQSF
jgi:3-oxoacyl-[acyl-carrier protein] reductase